MLVRHRVPSGMTGPASTVSLDASASALFLSDLHLGDGTKTDLLAGQDRALIAFLKEQQRRFGTVVFLGDVVDLPQAWNFRRVHRAHPTLIGHLRELSRDQQVIFVRGNHDWSVDYEGLFPGAACCEAVLIGERQLAWHGHQVDLHMKPERKDAVAKIYVHAIAERLVGRRLVPPLELHDSTANRIALSLAVAWARLSVDRARLLRSLGRRRKAAELEASVRYLARSVCGDPADIFGATTRDLLGTRFDAVVCGHSHVPGVVQTARGLYVNVGTWASGMRTYATWEDQRFAVYDVETKQEIVDQHYASVPAESAPGDLFDWWLEQWRRGLFRGAADRGVG